MGEEKEAESGSERGKPEGDGKDGQRPNPEKGLVGALDLLREAFEKETIKDVDKVVKCVFTAIEAGNFAAAKYLIEQLALFQRRHELTAEAYKSLAEDLWLEFMGEDEGKAITGEFEVDSEQ